VLRAWGACGLASGFNPGGVFLVAWLVVGKRELGLTLGK
jgi:hypothetical protein